MYRISTESAFSVLFFVDCLFDVFLVCRDAIPGVSLYQRGNDD